MSSSTVTRLSPPRQTLLDRLCNLRLPPPPVVIGLLVLCVFLLRLPTALIARQFNVDESQALSGAMKFLIDPRPWKAVDGGSWGPLNSYFISIFLLLGFKPGYILVHILASLLVCLQVFVGYFTIRQFESEKVAALGGFLFVFFYGVSTRKDYLHYSGELLPSLLLMLGFYMLLVWLDASPRNKRGIWLLFLAGLSFGVAPWCKLQAGPITAGLCLVTLVAVAKTKTKPCLDVFRRMGLLTFVGGAALTSCVMFIFLARIGALQDFWYSYVGGNLAYAGKSSLARYFVNCIFIVAISPLNQILAVGTAMTVYGFSNNKLPSLSGKQKWIFTGILVYAGTAILAVSRVAYPFRHHAIFLLPPMTYVVAALASYYPLTSDQSSRPSRRLTPGLLIALVLAAAVYLAYGVQYVRMIAGLRDIDRVRVSSNMEMGAAVNEARASNENLLDVCIGSPYLYLPDSDEKISTVVRNIQKQHRIRSLTVLGWAPGVYVLTAMPPSTRYAVAVAPKLGPYQQYYQTRFLGDLERNPPDLFIDVAAQGASIWSDRNENDGYESDPELRSFVERHYFQVEQLTLAEGTKPVRFFMRREPLSRLQ
jgi:hypothetical protein